MSSSYAGQQSPPQYLPGMPAPGGDYYSHEWPPAPPLVHANTFPLPTPDPRMSNSFASGMPHPAPHMPERTTSDSAVYPMAPVYHHNYAGPRHNGAGMPSPPYPGASSAHMASPNVAGMPAPAHIDSFTVSKPSPASFRLVHQQPPSHITEPQYAPGSDPPRFYNAVQRVTAMQHAVGAFGSYQAPPPVPALPYEPPVQPQHYLTTSHVAATQGGVSTAQTVSQTRTRAAGNSSSHTFAWRSKKDKDRGNPDPNFCRREPCPYAPSMLWARGPAEWCSTGCMFQGKTQYNLSDCKGAGCSNPRRRYDDKYCSSICSGAP